MEGSVSLSHVDVPTDTAIFVDPDSERARFLMPDGKIESWKSLTQVQIALDLKLWLVTWRTIGEAPETCFGICQRDGRYEIIVEFFEGREIELFPEFMRLILDQFHNPGGFLLPDGRYRSNMGVSFDLEFGLSGGVPRCTAVEETISVQPEFPYETVISLPSDAEIFDMAVKGVRQFAPAHTSDG
ncbi:MAG: hypothetical protein JSR72_03520 [Proteobacteria bacterium]|nr:hypothetical protein [Pseudomonadota bacterium]